MIFNESLEQQVTETIEKLIDNVESNPTIANNSTCKLFLKRQKMWQLITRATDAAKDVKRALTQQNENKLVKK